MDKLTSDNSATAKRVVEAEEFVLKGQDGRTLAVLASEPTGGATLRFFDARGTRRCVIGTSEQGTPVVKLGDTKGNPCLTLSQTDDGAEVQICDQDAQIQVCLGIEHERHHAYLTLGNAEGKSQFLLFANEDGSTSVFLQNALGEPVVGLRVAPDGTPAILVKEMGNVLDLLHSSTPNKGVSDGTVGRTVQDDLGNDGHEPPSEEPMVYLAPRSSDSTSRS